MKNRLLNTALGYNRLGLSVIPVGADKKPFVKWQRYQKEKASESLIIQWWEKWPDANIGIVTGVISEIAVIDIDTKEGKQAIQEYVPDSIVFPIVNTPSGGQHYYFKCTDGKISNNTRTIPGCDLRANGGYVVAPPSTNGNGKAYTWQDGLSIDQVELPELPSAYLSFILNNNIYKEKNNCLQTSTLSTDDNNFLTSGRRDNDLFHVANCLIKGGANDSITTKVLEILAENCLPEFPKSEIPIKIQSALSRSDKRQGALADEVRQWILSTTGNFLSTDVYNDLQVSTRQNKKNVSIILKRLCDEGLIEKYGNRNGCFRRVDDTADDINFLSANTKEIDIALPFNIDEFVNIYPRNIIIIAGSPDSGKTAFLLNTARLNMHYHKINYFSSEMAEQELKLRLSKFEDIDIKEFTKVKWLERASNFADVIRPDDINIIDYLEVHEDFWRIGGMIREVFDKLKKGIAIIAIQKDKHKEHGLGATRGLEKARLYITMNPGELRIVKAKNWASPSINPNGFTLNFKLFQGCKFSITKKWYK